MTAARGHPHYEEGFQQGNIAGKIKKALSRVTLCVTFLPFPEHPTSLTLIKLPEITDNPANPTKATASLLTRRGALRLLALSSAGLFAGTQSSEAFWDFFASFGGPPTGTLERLNIPAAWQGILGSNLPAYADYLNKSNLKHFKVRQVIEPHIRKRGRVQNTLPPKAMWANIRSTLKVIDSLSDRLDENVDRCISAYRSPDYNASCPGAKRHSYHTRNNAIDIVFPCSPGKVAAMARAMRSTGIFKGGVGRYSGFTHIDTRGSNFDW